MNIACLICVQDLHDDEVVTLDLQLATDSSISDLENLFMNSYSFSKTYLHQFVIFLTI